MVSGFKKLTVVYLVQALLCMGFPVGSVQASGVSHSYLQQRTWGKHSKGFFRLMHLMRWAGSAHQARLAGERLPAIPGAEVSAAGSTFLIRDHNTKTVYRIDQVAADGLSVGNGIFLHEVSKSEWGDGIAQAESEIWYHHIQAPMVLFGEHATAVIRYPEQYQFLRDHLLELIDGKNEELRILSGGASEGRESAALASYMLWLIENKDNAGELPKEASLGRFISRYGFKVYALEKSPTYFKKMVDLFKRESPIMLAPLRPFPEEAQVALDLINQFLPTIRDRQLIEPVLMDMTEEGAREYFKIADVVVANQSIRYLDSEGAKRFWGHLNATKKDVLLLTTSHMDTDVLFKPYFDFGEKLGEMEMQQGVHVPFHGEWEMAVLNTSVSLRRTRQGLRDGLAGDGLLRDKMSTPAQGDSLEPPSTALNAERVVQEIEARVADASLLSGDSATLPETPYVFATADPAPLPASLAAYAFKVTLLEAGETGLILDGWGLNIARQDWLAEDGQSVDLRKVSTIVKELTGWSLGLFLPHEKALSHTHAGSVTVPHILTSVNAFVSQTLIRRDLTPVEAAVLRALLYAYQA